LATLAAAGGYDDPERWWDDVVESRRDSVKAKAGIGIFLVDTVGWDIPSGQLLITPNPAPAQ